MVEEESEIARDVATVGRIAAVPKLLSVVCEITGMGFAAVARVTDHSWTACAVHDEIGFGLQPGGGLDPRTTLCFESRAERRPIVIDHASRDARYRDHHTPRIYEIESYISVPIIRPSGEYFGNLCAIDPRPRVVSEPKTITMFSLFADLVALQLDSEDRQRATESALLDARATAELREQFVGVLGHDLRSPLAAMVATAELLMRAPGGVDLARIGQRLKSTTGRMTRLIEDLMDFTRIRLGSGIQLALAEVDDLGAAITDVLSEIRSAHPDRQVIDRIAVEGRVWCDRGRLQQVVTNLAMNALTHGSPDHPVEVHARTVDRGALVLTVSNRGRPIAALDLDRIFRPYWRASESRSNGLGLGLHICAQIVESHRGTITVTSTEADGTRFEVLLPTAAPAA